MSLRSTLDDAGVTRRVTAATAIGARVDEYWDTIYLSAIQSVRRHYFSETHLGVQRSTRCTQQALFVI